MIISIAMLCGRYYILMVWVYDREKDFCTMCVKDSRGREREYFSGKNDLQQRCNIIHPWMK